MRNPKMTDRQSSETPETDAYFCGPCKNILSKRARNFARKLERERNQLDMAIRDFLERYERTRWGWDGDCGVNSLVANLEDSLPNVIDDESPPREKP